MKNSNIAWIGMIPDDWEIYRLGSIFSCRNEKVNDQEYLPLSVSKNGVVPQLETVAKSDANDNRKKVLKNDFVINSRSDRKQSCGLSNLEGSVSLINTVLYVADNDKLLAEYTNILLKNYGFAEEFYRWGHGIVADLWTTRWQEMKSIFLPVPLIDKQKYILIKLSSINSNIEKLIVNEQAQIEKLKEYRQSVITETVITGLDPTVPMKDSGVDWLGQVCQTHNIIRLKFLLNSNMMYGANEQGELYRDNYLRYIRITDITLDGKLKEEDCLYLPFEKAEKYILKNGDILFARSGATVGKSFIYKQDYGCCCFAGYLIKADCNTDKILPDYLMYYTQSSLYEIWKNTIFIQATIQNIGASKYEGLEIVLPVDITDQQKIVDYLDKKCADIDRLIEIKKQKIEKLNDYKKSLIYEYVTGKKEVN